jgi:hypothetical protein
MHCLAGQLVTSLHATCRTNTVRPYTAQSAIQPATTNHAVWEPGELRSLGRRRGGVDCEGVGADLARTIVNFGCRSIIDGDNMHVAQILTRGSIRITYGSCIDLCSRLLQHATMSGLCHVDDT